MICRISGGDKGIATWMEVDSSNSVMHESAVSGSINMIRTGSVRTDADDEDENLRGVANCRYVGWDIL